MKKNVSYNLAVDVIRVLAVLAVVAIHTTNSVFERPDFFGGKAWWLAIVINSISRISVPLFIMVSGYLLLKKDEKFAITFKRILNRLLIPLVFWTVLTYVLDNLHSVSSIFSLSFYVRFLSGDVYYFYFLVILIGLYFVSPLFSAYLRNSNLKSQKNLGLLFLGVGVIETIEEYLVRTCAVENSFTKWVPYAGLFIVGYLIGTNRLKFKKPRLLKYLYFLGLAATIGLNYLYYSSGSVKILRTNFVGCTTHYSDSYLSVNVVIMTVVAFALLFHTNYQFMKNTFLEKIVYRIARASFGIYLVHLFIVNIWDFWLKWNVDNSRIPLWSFVLIKWLAVFVVSYIFTVIIKKIPVIKRIIGDS